MYRKNSESEQDIALLKGNKSTWTSILNLPKIEFAPLAIPWERRKQTLGMFYYFSLYLHTQIILLLVATQRIFWPLLLIYFAYMFFDDKFERGGRPSEWYRTLPMWKWFCAYFPAKLVTEAELDPSKNYLFGVHPHGIIATGAFASFGSEALEISKIFPGLKFRILTLAANFYFPLYREFIYALGGCSASKRSINNIFKLGPGHSCVIVVGGAEESLISKPDTNELVLSKRYGFVAMAIKNGASLVPTYIFGENNLFDQVIPEPGTLIFKMQKLMKKIVGFTLPMYYGRTIFTYNYGFLPQRHPLTTVGNIFLLNLTFCSH